MIYELADHVQGFLSKYNKPPPSSFHEEMLKNQRRHQEKLDLEEKRRLDQRRKQEEDMVSRNALYHTLKQILDGVLWNIF